MFPSPPLTYGVCMGGGVLIHSFPLNSPTVCTLYVCSVAFPHSLFTENGVLYTQAQAQVLGLRGTSKVDPLPYGVHTVTGATEHRHTDGVAALQTKTKCGG